jgi:hypothetical protein
LAAEVALINMLGSSGPSGTAKNPLLEVTETVVVNTELPPTKSVNVIARLWSGAGRPLPICVI